MTRIDDAGVREYLHRRANEIDAALSELLPSNDLPPANLHQAMRYSSMGGGKRLRPVLFLTAGEALGGRTADLLPAACAIEMLHTYSLIHDDLPSMDNDDLRRGRATCHKAFDEATAILAGDALQAQAFLVLARDGVTPDPGTRVRAIREIAAAIGPAGGMVGGQVMDMESAGRAVDAATVDAIHRAKTGALIRASLVAGGLWAGANESDAESLARFGEHIGLAFQIVDDVLDLTQSLEQLGKTPGKDQTTRKATYPALYGIDASIARARQEVERSIDALEHFSGNPEALKALAWFSVTRRA